MGVGPTKEFFSVISYTLLIAEVLLALIAIVLLVKRHDLRRYKSLAAILMLVLLSNAVWGVVMPVVTHLYPSHPPHLFYVYYFYCFWLVSAALPILMFVFCCGLLVRTFSLLPGLQRVSIRVCWWVGLLICAVSVGVSAGPHMNAQHFMVSAITQMQTTVALVLIIVAVIVITYMRRLGFERRSSLFWFSLGLLFSAIGVFSASAFLFVEPSANVYAWSNILRSVALCIQLLCWVVGLSLPEPVPQAGNFSSGSFLSRWEQVSVDSDLRSTIEEIQR